MNRTILIILSLNISVLMYGQPTAKLEVGLPTKRYLKAGEKHLYVIKLSDNQFVSGRIKQHGTSVIITVTDPSEKQIGRFNMISGQEGFYFKTSESGSYKINLLPIFLGSSAPDSNNYVLELTQSELLGDTPKEQSIQLLNALYMPDGPGGAVAIVREGKIIFSIAYGLANIPHAVPFTTETSSNIGSVSKQFTGFAIALLEQEGKLSFDDDIRMYLPECPDFGQPVTIRNLLNHTSGYSGIKRTFGMKGIRGFWTREELVQQIQKQRQLLNPPGAEFNYTNTGYILLSEVVERISSVSFREWMKNNVFDPLGMKHSLVNSPIYAQVQRVVPNSAEGYCKLRGEYGHLIDEQALYGASSIYSTVIDLSKWLQNFSLPTIGGKALINQMTTPGILSNGDTLDYAFGLFIDRHNELLRYSHDGFDGFHWTEFCYYPEIDAGIIILNNCMIFPTLTDKLSELFFGDFMKSKEHVVNKETKKNKYFEVNTALLNTYTGQYSTEEDKRIIVTFEGNENSLKANVVSSLLLPSSFDLYAVNDSTFHNKSIDVTLIMHLDSNRQVQYANFKYSRDFILHRLPIYKPSIEDLMNFTGFYYSDELESVYTITIEDNSLELTIPNGMERKLVPKYTDTFIGEDYGEYHFRRRDNGEIYGFEVQSVHFEKFK